MLLAYRMVVKQEAQGRDHGEGSSFLIQLLLMIWQIWKCMGTYVFFKEVESTYHTSKRCTYVVRFWDKAKNFNVYQASLTTPKDLDKRFA